jgi:hypothetical protein
MVGAGPLLALIHGAAKGFDTDEHRWTPMNMDAGGSVGNAPLIQVMFEGLRECFCFE